MIYAIPYYEKDSHPELFDQMFRQRHQIFVEGRGWKELGKVDGREIDQFDTTSAIYFMAVGEKGRLQGGIRIKPTTGPTILGSVFPKLCTKREIPQRVDTWEMSRLFVCHHSEKNEQGVRIKGELMCAMYEFCMSHGIQSMTAIGDTFFLPRLMRAGVEALPLGLPQSYDTGEMIALELMVNQESLDNMRQYYQIPPNALSADRTLGGGKPKTPILDLPHDEQLSLLRKLETEAASGALEKSNAPARSKLVSRFVEIVKQLGTDDKTELKIAEEELDKLTEEVKETLLGDKTADGSVIFDPKRLQ